MLDHSVDLFGADKAGLWTVEDGNHPFLLVAQRGLGSAFLATVAEVQRGSPAAGWRAVAERRTMVLQGPWTTDIPAELVARYDEEGFRTICLVPVAYLDEPLGLLVLYHTRPHEWAAAELELLESFADQVAVALQNARLYASVRSFAARLDAIQDLAARLNRIHDADARSARRSSPRSAGSSRPTPPASTASTAPPGCASRSPSGAPSWASPIPPPSSCGCPSARA